MHFKKRTCIGLILSSHGLMHARGVCSVTQCFLARNWVKHQNKRQKITSGTLVCNLTDINCCLFSSKSVPLLNSNKHCHCNPNSSMVVPDSTKTFLHLICKQWNGNKFDETHVWPCFLLQKIRCWLCAFLFKDERVTWVKKLQIVREIDNEETHQCDCSFINSLPKLLIYTSMCL